MRHFQVLVAAILLFTITAAAQGPGTRSAPASAGTSRYGEWQLAVGYQYNRINLTGSSFHTNGYNVSLARYFGNWFGLEGQVGFGFGNTGTTTSPVNLSAKSIFAGGGPRLAYRGHFVEPWIHAVGGMEYFHFGQNPGVLGSNTALQGNLGGGVDFHLTSHTAFRTEADVMESRFFSKNQRHVQLVGGLVFNF